MPPSPAQPEPRNETESLIRQARAGAPEALGWLLQECRDYLLLVANRELDPALRAKGGASDLVQETFLEAQRDFSHFDGRSAEDLLAWLRCLLRHNLIDFTRRYRETGQRQLARERSLDDELRRTLAAETPSPQERIAAAEAAEALEQALVRLPEDYRQVIVLRHREGHSFPEIASQMNRSPDAARKLWLRAVERLREEVEKRP